MNVKRSFVHLILASIFFLLASIHFYWALGGEWGIERTLPANEQGMKILDPTVFDSIIVGTGLSLFGMIYLFSQRIFQNRFLAFAWNIVLWIIPLIFLLRAIGEFHYVGFFKSIKGTDFAFLDTVFYSPLCLGIALLGLIVVMRKRRK